MRVMHTVIMLLLVAGASAQQDTVYTVAETMPHFNGGDTAMFRFIKEQVVYPQVCIDSGIQGKVFVKFVVTEMGEVKNPAAIKGPHALLNAEAVRVVGMMPPFIPATNGGKNVSAYVVIPVTFKISAAKPVSNIYKVLSTCDKWPEFTGGDAALRAFFDKHIKQPKDAAGKLIQGMPMLGFIVDSTGKVGDVKLLRNAGPELDAEAVRVLQLLPAFKPARLAGSPVSAYLTMEVGFFESDNTYAYIAYHKLDLEPGMEGGDGAIYNKLEQVVRIPPAVLESFKDSIINISFVIDREGRLSADTIYYKESRAYYLIKAEIRKALLQTGPYLPAKKNGQVVDAYFTVAFKFRPAKTEAGLARLHFERSVAILGAGRDEQAFTFVDIPPAIQSPNGKSLDKYIASVLQYPLFEKNEKIQGKVVLRLMIDQDGAVKDVVVTEGVTEGLNKEAMRIAHTLPRFAAAEQNGLKVRAYYFLPVEFKLP